MFLTLGFLLSIAISVALRNLPLWRDTRINSVAGGKIQLASGHMVPSNRWFSLPADTGELGFLQIDEGGTPRNYLVQNDVSRDLAVMITPEGSKPLELVKAGGSGGRTEIWVEPRTMGADP